MHSKWHLGYFDEKYTPTYRGFDTFYGYYGDKEDYFTKNNTEWALIGGQALAEKYTQRGDGTYGMIELKGYDFRHGTEQYITHEYSTFFYGNETLNLLRDVVDSEQEEPFFLYWSSQAAHEPYQAPKERVDMFHDSIHSEDRRNLAAVISLLDDTIGEVVQYLKSEDSGNMWDDTLLIVSSDNGGAVTEGKYMYSGKQMVTFIRRVVLLLFWGSGASNFPLRYYHGLTRVTTLNLSF